ncbi:hypothetical protein Tco_0036226 [Tanacetum coccineum]
MVMVSPGVVRVYGGNVVRVSLTRGGIGLADVVVVARDGSLVVVFVDGSRISYIALRIVNDHKELASDGEVLRIMATKPDAFVENSSNILWKTINWGKHLQFRV